MDKGDLEHRAQRDLSHFDTCFAPVTRLTPGHRNPPYFCRDLSLSRWDDGGGCAVGVYTCEQKNSQVAAYGAQVKSQHVAETVRNSQNTWV